MNFLSKFRRFYMVVGQFEDSYLNVTNDDMTMIYRLNTLVTVYKLYLTWSQLKCRTNNNHQKCNFQ